MYICVYVIRHERKVKMFVSEFEARKFKDSLIKDNPDFDWDWDSINIYKAINVYNSCCDM